LAISLLHMGTGMKIFQKAHSQFEAEKVIDN
jgi:hypothetical protein